MESLPRPITALNLPTTKSTISYWFGLPKMENSCRSEEHTSELQSPVPISYAVFCLKKKKKEKNKIRMKEDVKGILWREGSQARIQETHKHKEAVSRAPEDIAE